MIKVGRGVIHSSGHEFKQDYLRHSLAMFPLMTPYNISFVSPEGRGCHSESEAVLLKRIHKKETERAVQTYIL